MYLDRLRVIPWLNTSIIIGGRDAAFALVVF